MKQRTLDFYFCGKKRERDVDLDDEDILQCYEDAQKQEVLEEIWNQFEEELQIDEMEEQAALVYLLSGEEAFENRPNTFFRYAYLDPDYRVERCWKLNCMDFKYLPENEDTLERWYWDLSDDIKKLKETGKMDEFAVPNADEMLRSKKILSELKKNK